MKTETLPQWLVEKAARIPDQTAMREKEFGIWQELTWAQLLNEVKAFSLGLVELGFQPQEKLAIIGDNRPEWIISEIAAQAAGGVSVGIYQDSLPKEIAYVLNHADAKIVVVEDQEQVDKLLEIEMEIPHVEKIIYYDRKGMRGYEHPLLAEFTQIQQMGRESNAWESSVFFEQVERGSADDVAILCYTSGTTGFPKGAMLSHRNLLNMAERLFRLDPLSEKDEYVSFLPLAWIGEQMMGVSGAFLIGYTINFPEETSTVQADLREIGPHVMFSPPRIWEDMVSRVLVRLQDAGWLKRKIYECLRPYGERKAEASISGRRLTLWERLMYILGDYLVFSAMKDHLGLLRLKRAYTGGASLGSDVTKFFHSLGVNLKQIYGQTEISGIAIVHHDGRIKFDTVGEPIPGTQMRISEQGEIMLKSASVFTGYYKNDQATMETITDGWLHTGDAGYIDDDGHLVVIDRLKDVIRLDSGEMFSPQYIENKLKFSPYIKEAVAVGTNRPYVAAMLNIDMANVGRWAEVNQVAYTTYTDLSQKSEVLQLIRHEVERINHDLPEKAKVKRFVLLYKELDADDEELTRTKKVRRGFVAHKYEAVIAGLYGDGKLLDIEGTIKYRDGKEATIRAQMEVVDVGDSLSADGEVA
ncbi:AMP-binding protein [Brevibacillus humidisoli]|uniref:AMP-binding protein n=1 Tax=Brevibacillus humidisoli TaxID=2895522 RepID=UPI001E3EC5D0|nr:AMP-binding protein [Brevibacillus humidisoli]UFJ41593.1 AMP-binding protein [Brevibacillus humidisoli]